MNIHFGNQSQFELFPKTTGDTIENVAPRFIFSRIVLSFENLVVIFVFILISLIVAYSIGVERGRRHTAVARPVAQAAVPVAVKRDSVPHPQLSVSPVVPVSVNVVPVSVPPAEIVRTTTPSAPVLPPFAQNSPSEKVVDKGYTIQVASYKSESFALKEANALQSQGMKSLVLMKGSHWIVCVGQFAKPDEAKKLLNKLKKKYKDSLIRSF